MSKVKAPRNLCLGQTDKSVTSISTTCFVPQPLPHKSHYVQNRLFVGSIPATVSKSEITLLMRQFGEITETNLIDDGFRRFAFVTFEHIDSADAVLSLYQRGRPFVIRGCPVTINRAYFKPKKADGSKGKYPKEEQGDAHQGLGVYYNGTVYFNLDSSTYMQNTPNCSNWLNSYGTAPVYSSEGYCYYEPQEKYYYSDVANQQNVNFNQIAPLGNCPMIQQTYKTEYNIKQNVNISQMVEGRINRHLDNTHSTILPGNEQTNQEEWITVSDLDNSNAGNGVSNAQDMQSACNVRSSHLAGYWCTNARCLSNVTG